ncbi:ligand-binding sensor domain-containing protein [Bizionia psychrotolerans]|uniref:ligand-binding sensor domain-containing protein n=1 Tax=Bizionia psychrotolerans TaxID=1492901 RepID=UPI0009E4480D|nr:two-component regulator propeller domain-containing protein [Bizionia psychrotolerans]
MKKSRTTYKTSILLLLLLIHVTSCNSKKNNNSSNKELLSTNQIPTIEDSQIGDYVVNVFEDSKGNLWFSTLTYGLAKYDGNKLTYITSIGKRVGSIVEDSEGNLWFGTHSGIYKYNPSATLRTGDETFTNYSVNDGLCDNLVSTITIDKKGTIWVGTWGGICKFNGTSFIHFPIPNPDIEVPSYQETTNWISEIMEDSKGNMWFARDGYGATKFDPSAALKTGGKAFTHFTKKDGLASNNVTDIQEDKLGNIWFASRITEKDHPDETKKNGPGGLVKYDGSNFIDFPDLEGLYNSDVFQIYRDSKDNIWISAQGHGVYKFDGHSFINYKAAENTSTKAVMSILEDSKGSIWLGSAGGLFRLDSRVITNITTNGPW